MTLLNRAFTLFAASAAFALLSSCSPKDFNEPGIEDYETLSTDATFNVDPKAAWTATFNVMSRYPIVYINEKKYEIQTDWIKGKSERLFSEYGENRVPYNIRFRLHVRLNPSGGSKTKIYIENTEQYFTDIITSGGDFNNSLYEWIDTESTTYKENAVLKKIELELKQMFEKGEK